MNIFRTAAFRIPALALALPLAALVFAGCDVGSVDSTSAVATDNSGTPTIYNYAGLYARVDTNGTLRPLVFPEGQQSGTPLTWLRLFQYGTALEAYDNAGLTWSGNISAIRSGVANFTLSGRTTAGIAVEIAGTIDASSDSDSTSAFMDAAWIEPSFSGNIMAYASVSPATTNVAPTNSPTNATGTTAVLRIRWDPSLGWPNTWRVARHAPGMSRHS